MPRKPQEWERARNVSLSLTAVEIFTLVKLIEMAAQSGDSAVETYRKIIDNAGEAAGISCFQQEDRRLLTEEFEAWLQQRGWSNGNHDNSSYASIHSNKPKKPGPKQTKLF